MSDDTAIICPFVNRRTCDEGYSTRMNPSDKEGNKWVKETVRCRGWGVVGGSYYDPVYGCKLIERGWD